LASPAQALNRYPRPYMEITIRPLVDGLLETFQVDRGDLVKEGQILAGLVEPEPPVTGE
jgi:multidrug efflux pump subunit AcrA (membrane-fusion protein)